MKKTDLYVMTLLLVKTVPSLPTVDKSESFFLPTVGNKKTASYIMTFVGCW